MAHLVPLTKQAPRESGSGGIKTIVGRNRSQYRDSLMVDMDTWRTCDRPYAFSDDGLTPDRAPCRVMAEYGQVADPTRPRLLTPPMRCGSRHLRPRPRNQAVHWLAARRNEAGRGGAAVMRDVAGHRRRRRWSRSPGAGWRGWLVTGGPGVVKAAMASGKKAICAGPGNPPAVPKPKPTSMSNSLLFGIE